MFDNDRVQEYMRTQPSSPQNRTMRNLVHFKSNLTTF